MTGQANSNLIMTWVLDGQVHRLPLQGEETRIGRAPTSHILLSAGSVSRAHARIIRGDDAVFYIEDLGSKYGTWVNERRVPKGARIVLRPGADVRVGKLTLWCESEADERLSTIGVASSHDLPIRDLTLYRVLQEYARTADLLIEASIPDPNLVKTLVKKLGDPRRHLADQLKERQQEHLVLHEITHAIGSLLDLEEVLHAVLRLSSKVLNADRGFILLHDERTDQLNCVLTRHFDEENDVSKHELDFSDSIARQCFKEKSIVLLSDAMSDRRFSSAKSVVSGGIRGVLAIPLMQGQDVSGVIYMDNLNTPGSFRENQLGFLKTLGVLAANAIHNARLYRSAITDDLTGLYHRKFIEQCLHKEMSRSARYGNACSLAIIDLDHFKKINDTHGHNGGDLVLIETGRLLRETARESDLVGRHGGEEFILVLPETDKDHAVAFAERLRQALVDMKVVKNGTRIPVTASIGVAGYQPTMGDHPIQFIEAADRALYQAKAEGRNRVVAALSP